MSNATLAFYKGEGLAFNRIIRWWTKSIYSHTELVIEGQSYSASERKGEKGARVKLIAFNPEHWDFVDGVYYVTSTIRDMDLESAKTLARREVNHWYERDFFMFEEEYPSIERETWSKQESEARGFAADNSFPTPFIDSLAASRGVDKEILVSKILEKANQWVVFSATASGKRQRLFDSIDAATDVHTLAAVSWFEG